ncbi:Formin-like protein 13 [Gracilariopsis chorda]|uniref:Formin-like protein 13 n=1 Tax=Gracilariopsis chorda TaxID=448386 RepID=A0A2V3IZV2_9FLOR|nr:Formin-like protein 13 [Gracilariopsis chorda]|eukprot:PXF47668.1 Formin-like protein 13 [Gracilariopsis chorda]
MARRSKRNDAQVTLEDRLGPDVLKKLETMAGEFVRFEKGDFGFFIDPARYAVKQRQVGPLGRGRRRKVVAGVDKDGNIITAWIGVDNKSKGTKTDAGELVNIPDGYGDGTGHVGTGTGKGGGKGTKGGGKGGGGGGGGSGSGSGSGGGSGSGDGSGGGGGGSGGGGGTGSGAPNSGGSGPGSGQGGRKSAAKPPASAAEVAKQAAEKRAIAGVSSTPEKKDEDGTKPAAPTGPPVPKPPVGNLQAKANEARGRKKKPLHWAKVPKNLLKDAMWTSLDDSSIRLNEDEIDELFGVDVAPQFVAEAEAAKPEVLPHKRKHNVNIILANLKMTTDQIKDVVRVPTYKELEASNLQALLMICPTPEEEQLLNQNQNIIDEVDKTDRFMMELAQLPGLRGKVLCGLSAKTFNEEAIDLIKSMDTYAMIPVEVENSAKLNKMLEIVLALGNFLNSGTGRGGAHGFKLEALAMLSTVKDSRGDTLLDYLVKIIMQDYPHLYPLDDMPTLQKSEALSLDAIGEDVQAILDSVTNVAEQIKQIGDDPSMERFKSEMSAFSEEATKVREEIVSLRALMMEKLQHMMAHFGERNKAARGRQEDILRMLREFSADLTAAVARYNERCEREAKKAAKAGGKPPAKPVPSGENVPALPDAPQEGPSVTEKIVSGSRASGTAE